MPCWQLLGEQARERLTPYASLQPEVVVVRGLRRVDGGVGDTRPRLGFTRRQARGDVLGPLRAQGAGRAGRVDRRGRARGAGRGRAGHDAHGRRAVRVRLGRAGAALRRGDRRPTTCSSSRRRSGSTTWRATPSSPGRSPVRIASGEWLSSRHEFADADRAWRRPRRPARHRPRRRHHRGAPRRASMAADHDRLVVPHAWKTGISVAVAAHLAMVTPHMPFFEFLPAELCESRLRKELVDRRAGLRRRRARRSRAVPASASSSTATRSPSSPLPRPASPDAGHSAG